MNLILPTVSVGIPAYNEEANIGMLLNSILVQKESNFLLKEIIISSDNSSDKTLEIVSSFNDPRIIVIDNKKRKGQAENQNGILEKFSSDILVLLNADVLPKNDCLLTNIVNPLLKDESIGIVGGKVTPLPNLTYFEGIINFSTKMKSEMVEKWNNGNNILSCHGRIRAFSSKLTKKLRFGPSVAEDAYSYLVCKENGLNFVYEPQAEILYRSPQNLSDHIKQSSRYFSGNKMLQNYFPKLNVKSFFTIPQSIVLKVTAKYLLKNPYKFLIYILLLSISIIKGLTSKSNKATFWESSVSSKSL